MPFLIEHIIEVVFTIVVVVLVGTGVLAGLAITRRQRRERFFQRIDDVRQRFAPVVAAALRQRLDYDRALEALKGISGLDRVYILEQLLMAKAPTPPQVPVLRQLCQDLGLVKIWQKQLAGQFDVTTLRDALTRPEGLLQRIGRLTFLLRAKSAENLGTIRHEPSSPLLTKALDDPHADVVAVAARALALIGNPKSFQPLAARLHAVVLSSSSKLSLRSIKSALVTFPLKHARELLPSLNHTHRRIRFLAVDIIREMVEREAALEEDFVLDPSVFSADLAELFLTKLCFDSNPDVRARAAPVIAFLPDPRSVPVLLALLEDQQWFVRLHATRALARRKFLSQVEKISERLTDSHWMVREAAARALPVFGRVGIDQLCEHLLSNPDRYSREQVADEMQRAGIIPTLLTQYGSAVSDGLEAKTFRQLAEMHKTSYLVWTVASLSDRSLRKKFLMEFGESADPQIRSWVKQMATREADPEIRIIAAQLARGSSN